MILHTLWGVRRGEADPELMIAWDEYSVDENRDGFNKDCDRAIKSWGDDLAAYRYIDIHLNPDRLADAFNDVQLEGFIR